MAESEKKELFVSYCTKNKELAQLFCNVIEGAGVSCWMAPRDIPSGGSWATAIAKGIEDASLLALLVSDASMTSAEVEKEVDLANGRRMTILPIRIENAELKGAFKYHLSNKQWVDALEEDQKSRYKNTTEAILQNLGKDSSENDKAGSGYLTLARLLANDLNNKYADSLNQINSMFSARNMSTGKIEIFFPFRLGATGADVRCQFDIKSNLMEIFADLAIMDDQLKLPFTEFVKEKMDYFPRIQITSNRRDKIVIFEPAFPIAIGSVNLSEEKPFGIFRDNTLAFLEVIMPELLEWAKYGQYIVSTIEKLVERLRNEFPESQGWRIGAPENERLDAFNTDPRYDWRYGRLNIYKENWVPKQPLSFANHKGRGMLSFTLESRNSFFDKLSIGILKYDSWYELGDVNEKIISDGIGEMALLADKPDGRMVWQGKCHEEWQNSGIRDRSFRWQSKGDEFINYCIENFKKLKHLENQIDEICTTIPDLQVKGIEYFPPERKKWVDGLYVYNRLRMITEEIAAKVTPDGLTMTFKTDGFQHQWTPKEVYLGLKVGQFDAVAAINCHINRMTVELKNMEPPDFETEFIKKFISNRKKYDPQSELIVAQNNFDSGTEDTWLERFASFVATEVDKIQPEFIALKKHLETIVNLATDTGKKLHQALGGEKAGWKVENKAVSLEQMSPISFWHESWLKTGAKDDDLPPLMFQIVPRKPCFDDLVITIRQNEPFAPEFEHRLGMVCGACEFAFGKGHDPQDQIGIWSTNFPIFNSTEGSSLNNHALSNEDNTELDKNVSAIAGSVLKMESRITEICKVHNFQTHFLTEIKAFIDRFTNTLSALFPEKEGWKMGSDISSLKRGSCLRFYKQTWQGQKSEQKYGILNITLQFGSDNFDNLLYGIMPTESITPEQTKIIHDKMTELFKNGRSSDGWPWWQFAETPFRKTGGKEQKLIDEKSQSEMIEYFRKKFSRMKDEIAPLIDTLLTETNKNVTQIASSEVKPA